MLSKYHPILGYLKHCPNSSHNDDYCKSAEAETAKEADEEVQHLEDNWNMRAREEDKCFGHMCRPPPP